MKPSRNRVKILVAFFLVLGVCIAAYSWIQPNVSRQVIENGFQKIIVMRENPYAPIFLAATIFFGTLIFVPFTVLTVGAALVFQNVTGFIVTVVAMLASAAFVYGIGGIARHRLFSVPPRLEGMRRFFSSRGVWSIAAFRLLPVAPFHLVNFSAGYFSVPLKSFLAGTFIAFLPFSILVFVFSSLWFEPLYSFYATHSEAVVISAAAIIAAFILYLIRQRRLKTLRSLPIDENNSSI